VDSAFRRVSAVVTLEMIHKEWPLCPPLAGGIPTARVSEVSRRLDVLSRYVFSSRLGRVRLIVVIFIALIIIALIVALRISREPSGTEAESAAQEAIASRTGEAKIPSGEASSPAPSPVKLKVPTEQMTFDELMKFIDGPVHGKDSWKVRMRDEDYEEWKSRCDLIRQVVRSYIDSLDQEDLEEEVWRLLDVAGDHAIQGHHPMHTTILKLRALPVHLALLEHATDPATWGYWVPWKISEVSPMIILDAFKSLDMGEEFQAWAKRYLADLESRLSKAAAERDQAQTGFKGMIGYWEIKMRSARARLYEAFGEEAAAKAKSDTIDYMIDELRFGDTIGEGHKNMLLEYLAALSREIDAYDRATEAFTEFLPSFEAAFERAHLLDLQAELFGEWGKGEEEARVRDTAIAELAPSLEGLGQSYTRQRTLEMLASLCEKAERYLEAIEYYETLYGEISGEAGAPSQDDQERKLNDLRTAMVMESLTEEEAALFKQAEERLTQLRGTLLDYYSDHGKFPDRLDELAEGGYVADAALLKDPVTGERYEYTPGLGINDHSAVILRSKEKHGLATILQVNRGASTRWRGVPRWKSG